MNPHSFRILITNCGIKNRTGTEIVTMELARGLASAGHRPMIWAPILCPSIAADLISSGIPTTANLDELPYPPDVIHGHHHLETVEAIRRFPDAPAIFVCHSGYWWHDAPPRHPAIRRYVGVDQFCCERLAIAPWIEQSRISRILNAVDLEKFRRRPSLPERPRRALVFSNDAAPGTHLDPIVETCRAMDLDLDCAGSGVGKQTAEPHLLLPKYDLVFGKARCALEAMAAGCAVTLCDTMGFGGMVRRNNVEEFRLWNFGFRLLTCPASPTRIRQEIETYDSHDASEVTDYIRRDASFSDAVQQYISLYKEVLDESVKPDDFSNDYPETRPVQIEDQEKLHIFARNVPATVAAGTKFEVLAAIENNSPCVVATAQPWPCFLMYRWIDSVQGTTVVEHGMRSIIQPPVQPYSCAEYTANIIAPKTTGDYVLRLTMIQEGWRWLDHLQPPVSVEVPVSVTER